MPAAPPAAETKKPATPPAKDAKANDKAAGGAGKAAAGQAGGATAGKAQDKAGGPQAAGGAKAAGAKAAGAQATGGAVAKPGAKPEAAGATAGQQRFDRMAVRAKLAVSEPGDAVEREADAIADKVLRMPEVGAAKEAGKPKPAASGKSDEVKRKEEPQDKNAAKAKPPGNDKPATGAAQDTAKAGAKPGPEIQRKQDGPAKSEGGKQGAADQPGTTQELIEKLGAGEPLDADTQAYFAKRMGADFGAVRIHTDAAAAQSAKQLNARAFTYGHHIAFATNAYQPQSESGKLLLAHELAHVMQQAGGVTRMIMRGPAGGGSATGGGDFEVAKSALDVPPIKARHLGAYGTLASARKLKRKGAYDASARGTKQVGLWTGGVKVDINKIPAAQRPSTAAGPSLNLNVSGGASAKVIQAGSIDELTRLLQIPTWNGAGADIQFQVDHMVEYQLGGADDLANMELLNQAHNGSVGSSFSHGIKRTVREEIEADPTKPVLAGYAGLTNASGAPTAEGVMEAMTVVFTKVKGRARESGRKESGSMFWSKEQIEALDHVLPLLGAPGSVDGDATNFALLSPTGNLLIAKLAHGNGQTKIDIGGNQAGGMAGFKMKRLVLNSGYNDSAAGGNIGTLEGRLDFGPAVTIPAGDVSVGISQAAGPPPGKFSGKLGAPTGDGLPNQVEFKPMSPLQLSGITFGRGVFGKATLQPSHPALAGINIPATIEQGRLGLFYTLDATTLAGKLKIPGIKIDSAGITFGYDGSDFSVGGGTEFTVQKFGTGFLNARTDTGGDFELEGGLRADKRLFDQADMKLWYRKKGGFGGSGTLGITTPGKVKGLKSAKLSAKYEDSIFSATGDVVPDIPGLKSASLSVTYANEQLQIKGSLGIDDKVPGVQAADITVEVTQADDAWKVAASGNVTPTLPGLTGAQLAFSYKDGFVLIEGEFGIEKGPISGKVKAGVTNGTVDDEGLRTDVGSGDKFTVFGAAEVDAIFIKDRLAGKLKLRLLPDGSTRVGGDLKVGDFEVFPQIPKGGGVFLNKPISSPRIPLPGAGFSVGSMSVGVTFWASGYVKAHASVGPGKMSGITLSVAEFDPGKIDLNKLEIGGKANFAVQGDAGLQLGVDANVGLSAAVVDLVGSLGITAEVGIPEQTNILSAGTDFTYSRANGLNLGASCNLDISPSLTFKLKGGFSARLNLYVDTITIWHKDWTLAQANYQLPIGITANGKLSYNSKTDKLSVDPASAIKVKTPEFKTDDFLRILTGAPAPEKAETVDQGGKPAGGDPPKVNPKRDDKAARNAAPSSVDENIVTRLGSGEPLDLATRGFFEQALGADLTQVRIHRGPSALREAEKLSAKAFTVGDHIAFAAGQYQPDSVEGKELLGHELAHVLQQNGGAARQVMREPSDGASTPAPAAPTAPAAVTPAAPTAAAPATGTTARSPITLPTLRLPELKYGAAAENAHCKAAYDAALAANVERPAGYRRADVDSRQRTLWTGATPAPTLRAGLALKVPGLDADKVYVAVPRGVTLAGAGTQVIVGNPNEIALALRQPRWDRLGHADPNPFEIDHMIELQIGGPGYDRLANLELLERSANGASGRAIDASLDEAFANYARSPAAASLPAADRTAEVLKRQYRVRFAGFTAQGAPAAGKRWALPEVQAAKPVEGLRIYDPSALLGSPPTDPNAILHPWPAGVDATRFTGSPTLLVVYASPRGGEPRQVPLRNGQPENAAGVLAGWLPGLDAGALNLSLTGAADGPIGHLRGRLNHPQLAADAKIDVDIPVKRRRGLANAGVLDTELLLDRLRGLLRGGGVSGLSPVTVDEVDVQPGVGLVVSGHVQPTIEMIRNASLDFQIRGQDLSVSKTFQGGDIALGGPLRIDGSDLTLRLGTRSGLQVDGGVAFSIDKLGQGTLRGAGRSEGFEVEGNFDFDRRLFDADARIALAYRRGADAPEGKLSGSGTVGIGPGKVRGIRRATVQAAFDGPQRSLNGNAELDLPGVESASLGVLFTPEGGTEISGTARFRDRPGIRNGQISVTLTEASEGWSLSARGAADASFAGVSARLDASYANGLFMFAADAPFAVGSRVSGSLRLGLTNGHVDDQGRLIEGSAPAAGSGDLHPFGNGTVNLRLTDWLGGGIGIKVRPSGELLVSGRIGIPAPVTVFEQYPSPERATRTLFQMPTVSVPLIGLSVGSTVIGVALTINGRVNGFAHVGPGRLTQTELRVEDFNPAQPESLHVTGDGEFDLAAEAGVSASLDAGVTLGAAIINATAGLSVSAAASLRADVRPQVALDWRQASGLHLHADLAASLSPRLAFDLNGYAEVVANAVVTTFTLWRKDWNLAHREIGSNLSLRVNAPVDYYSDGRGVVFDPAAVQFEVPSLNADTLSALMNQQGGSERVERAAPA